MIEDCEKKIDHLIFKPSEEEKMEVIKKEDVYKEVNFKMNSNAKNSIKIIFIFLFKVTCPRLRLSRRFSGNR